MSNLKELDQQYPKDKQLTSLSRDVSWVTKYRPEISLAVDNAIQSFGLDASWEEISEHPLKTALANALWSCSLACFGPKINPDQLRELNALRFGSDYATKDVASHVFTGNHLSVSCRILPLSSDGERIAGPVMVHHMPTFASIEGGKPAIGDLSPIVLEKNGEQFILTMTTPSGYVWKKTLEVLPAASFTTQMVGKDGSNAMIKSIASPCVSAFQVLILRPDCQENCIMCTVPRGAGVISEEYQTQVYQTLDILINEAAVSNHAFQQTFTGGSSSDDDGGFATAHAWGMEILANKLAKKEDELGIKIPVQIQLEMVLPKNQSTWPAIIDTLAHYTKDLGWKISLAMNMEVIQDAWKGLFLQGPIKSITTLADHLAFAKTVQQGTDDMVHMNSLVMFGMKPKEMDDALYMTTDLLAMQQMIAVGIKPDYQPVKIEANTSLEAYPPPNPVLLMLQDLALKQIVSQSCLPWSPGCVGGCNACDQSHEITQLLNATKRAGVFLPDVLAPMLNELGEDYTAIYRQIFSSLPYSVPVTIYENQ